MDKGWFLVETSGSTPAVVMVGARSKQWRPVSNMFRGSVYTTVLQLLDTVLNNLKQSQVLLDVGGPRLALAQPVLGPSRQVHAILMWIGDATETPPPEPPVWAFAWELADPISPEFVDDPETGTMTDWLSGCARLSDIRRTAADVYGATVGDRFAGDWIRTDGTVERYTMRVVFTFDGPAILGVSLRLPETTASTEEELLPRAALQATATYAGTSTAVLHAASGRVLAWLTDGRPNFPDEVVSGRIAAPTPSATSPIDETGQLILGIFDLERHMPSHAIVAATHAVEHVASPASNRTGGSVADCSLGRE